MMIIVVRLLSKLFSLLSIVFRFVFIWSFFIFIPVPSAVVAFVYYSDSDGQHQHHPPHSYNDLNIEERYSSNVDLNVSESIVNSFLLRNQIVPISRTGAFGFGRLRSRSRSVALSPPHVRFYLYTIIGNTYEYRKDEELLIGAYKLLKHSKYNPKLPLIMILHGFLSNSTVTNGEVDTLRRAYFETKFKANIMAADYSTLVGPSFRITGVSSLYYPQAIRNVPIIGNAITQFLLFLMQSGFIQEWNHVHLIGFSLGAHIAGFVGQRIYKKAGSKIGRITGLDPAGFLFYFRGRNAMLDPSDANFVDVTHTAQGFYGFKGRLGHVDYWVNGGGPKQPGCLNLRRPITLIDSCSHTLAYEYYAESIRNPHILACPCIQCWDKSQERGCRFPAIYGEHVGKWLRGTFKVQIQPKRRRRRN